jgi:hypothetical protein
VLFRLNLFVKYVLERFLSLDPNTKNNEIAQMLRACYLYTLYEELCINRGNHEGKILCSKILKV